jgi:glycosyltransferase involved in cell wall biosynthesis
LVTCLNSTGFGQTGKGVLRGLAQLGEPFAFRCVHEPDLSGEYADEFEHLLGQLPEPDPEDPTLLVWHDFDLSPLRGLNGPRVLYTFFELDRLPGDRARGLNTLDGVAVPTRWAEKVLRDSGVTVPVAVVRPGVDTAIFHPGVTPAALPGVADSTFVVLFAGKWEVRKGCDQVVDIFNRAFRPDDDALLVMHSHNWLKAPGFDGPDVSRQWGKWATRSPMGRAGKVHVSATRFQTQGELASLMRRAQVGLFPARAEGWNLEAAEVAAVGGRVFMSDNSGHEYGPEAGAFMLKASRHAPMREPPFIPYTGEAGWYECADDELDAAAAALRGEYERYRTSPSSYTPNPLGPLFARKHTWLKTASELREFARNPKAGSSATSPTAS